MSLAVYCSVSLPPGSHNLLTVNLQIHGVVILGELINNLAHVCRFELALFACQNRPLSFQTFNNNDLFLRWSYAPLLLIFVITPYMR